jgi:hypothetical protein
LGLNHHTPMRKTFSLLIISFITSFAATAQQEDQIQNFTQDYTPSTGRPVHIKFQVRVFKYAGQVNYRIYIQSVTPRGNTFAYEGKQYRNEDLGGNYLDKIDYSNVKAGTLEYKFSFFNQLRSTTAKEGSYSFASMSLESFGGDGAKIWSKEELGNSEYEKLNAKNVSVNARITALNVDNSPVVSRIRVLSSNEKNAKALLDKAEDQYGSQNFTASLSTIKQAEKACDNCTWSGSITRLRSIIEEAISEKDKRTKEEKEKKGLGGSDKSSLTSSGKKSTEEKSESGNSTSSFDKDLYYACLSLSNAVMQKVQYARNHRSDAQAWRDAQTAINNFRCQYTGISQDVIDEVNRNVTATTVSDAVVSSIDYFTSAPWTYGYGQFLDASNKTYMHRFILGMNGEYTNRFADISFSINCNLMRLPSRQLHFKFKADNNATNWNAEKTKAIDNINSFMLAIGPRLTFWPQKNFFVAATPEIMLGSTYGNDVPTGTFNYAPSLNTQAGFRLGKVYLSGSYGFFYLKLIADAGKYGGSEAATLQTNQYGTINGRWMAEKFDKGEAVMHKYWLVSLGLNL